MWNKQVNTKLCFVELNVLMTVHLAIIFVNNQLDAQFFFMYVYFYSLHVSGSYVSIIRRINCINTTSGICPSVYMTVQYAGLDKKKVFRKCCNRWNSYCMSYKRNHKTFSLILLNIYKISHRRVAGNVVDELKKLQISGTSFHDIRIS